EVVGDAAGQLPDRFHLLGPEELFPRRALFGDIPHECIDDEAVAAAQRSQRHLGNKFAAVLVQQERFVASTGAVGRSPAQAPAAARNGRAVAATFSLAPVALASTTNSMSSMSSPRNARSSGEISTGARVTPSERKYLNGVDRMSMERSIPSNRLAAALASTI